MPGLQLWGRKSGCGTGEGAGDRQKKGGLSFIRQIRTCLNSPPKA